MSLDFSSQAMSFGFGSLAMGGAAVVNKLSSNKRPFPGNSSNDMSYSAMIAAPSESPNLDMNIYSSTPKLALTLTSGLDSKGEMIRRSGDPGKNKIDEEIESRSGSDNVDGNGSGDDQEDNPPRKKPYHRHTPQQIQEMEAFFKECPHPDDNQRQQLSKKVHLAPIQIKFWFQNRRTQMKAHQERHENAALKDENEKLRMENLSIKEAMSNPTCCNCGGSAMLSNNIPCEEQQLRIENARLKDEFERLSAITGKLCGRPFPQMASHSPMHNASLGMAAVSAGVNILDSLQSTVNPTTDFLHGLSTVDVAGRAGSPRVIDKGNAVGLAVTSMDELFTMARMQQACWIPSPHDGVKETLDYDAYIRQFPAGIGQKPLGYKTEGSRHASAVIMNSMNLVETLMDANRYAELFPSIISRATTLDVLCSGVGGTRHNEVQLMYMELQVLSPLCPTREFYFLRLCQQHGPGIWAVVDVSADHLMENRNPALNCRRRPSGCIIQDLPNNCSNVTWIEHIEYDERGVHNLYRSLVSSGLAFGCQRWLSTLQRQCERLALLMEINVDPTAIPDARSQRNLLKLAQRMTSDFCNKLSASVVNNWATLSPTGDEDIRVSTRMPVENPALPGRVVLSAATSIWLPVTPQKLFDYLRDERHRSQWDMLTAAVQLQEITCIRKGHDHGNSVRLLGSNPINTNRTMFILQECCTDAFVSTVVYAPIDMASIRSVMTGGNTEDAQIWPSGFVILPDGFGTLTETGSSSNSMHTGGSILTVSFQLLLDNMTTSTPGMEDFQAVQDLISCTVQKIKSALILDDA